MLTRTALMDIRPINVEHTVVFSGIKPSDPAFGKVIHLIGEDSVPVHKLMLVLYNFVHSEFFIDAVRKRVSVICTRTLIL